MKDIIIQLLASFLSAFSFALLFHVRKNLVLPASFGGVLCWGIYLACCSCMEGIFYPSLITTICSTVYAEVLARILRAPAPIFFVPTIIVLVPGGSLFYAMSAAVQGDMELAAEHTWTLVLYVLALAAGASLVWALSDMIRKLIAQCRHSDADI